MMQRRTYLGVALLAVALLAGCGRQEIEELRGKVAGLEGELAQARTQAEAGAQRLTELQAALAQQKTENEQLTAELVKVKVQRDKLKQELAALKKKRR